MPTCVIAESRYVDSPEVCSYRELAKASILQHGGRFLARGALPEALEGDWPESNRMVVIEFPDLAQAKEWYHSPEYAAARATRSEAPRFSIDVSTDLPTPPTAVSRTLLLAPVLNFSARVHAGRPGPGDLHGRPRHCAKTVL